MVIDYGLVSDMHYLYGDDFFSDVCIEEVIFLWKSIVLIVIILDFL